MRTLRLLTMFLMIGLLSSCVVHHHHPADTGDVSERIIVEHHDSRIKYNYMFYPAVSVYYDIDRHLWFYFETGSWRVATVLPVWIVLPSRDDSVIISVNSERPYDHYDRHKKRYPSRRDRYRYRYYPSLFIYFDINRGLWFYLEGGRWRNARRLPRHIVVPSHSHHVELEMYTERPYDHFKRHKTEHPSRRDNDKKIRKLDERKRREEIKRYEERERERERYEEIERKREMRENKERERYERQREEFKRDRSRDRRDDDEIRTGPVKRDADSMKRVPFVIEEEEKQDRRDRRPGVDKGDNGRERHEDIRRERSKMKEVEIKGPPEKKERRTRDEKKEKVKDKDKDEDESESEENGESDTDRSKKGKRRN
ncbi:MAG: hypothetical protein JSV21_11310 [Nitrospirota bacterium]|nr:MAG: hypothetical protein JSV21_11310 [Nitrospirota bacterium]